MFTQMLQLGIASIYHVAVIRLSPSMSSRREAPKLNLGRLNVL